MLRVPIEHRITLQHLLNSAVDGEIYDCDVDRFIGIYLDDKIRQEIKKALREILCQKLS